MAGTKVKKSGFIVTKGSSVEIRYIWTMNDSLDGVLYETYGAALQQCLILDAAGVVELEEAEEEYEETSNGKED